MKKNICVYGASSNNIDEKYIKECEKLGELIAARGYGLVFGGGAGGVMGAAARGVRRAGGYITGIAPSFFNTDGVLYTGCDEFIYPETMRERKKLLEDMSVACIAAPGGIGTFDEFFEMISLKQLGRHNKAIVLLDLFGYFDPLVAMIRNAVDQKFAGDNTFEIFRVCRTNEEALDYIESYAPTDVDFRQKTNGGK